MNGIIVGVPEIERVRDGVAVLMNEWHSAVINLILDVLALEPYGLSSSFNG